MSFFSHIRPPIIVPPLPQQIIQTCLEGLVDQTAGLVVEKWNPAVLAQNNQTVPNKPALSMAKLYRVQLVARFTTQDNVAQKCEYSIAAAGQSGRSSACGIWGSHSGGVIEWDCRLPWPRCYIGEWKWRMVKHGSGKRRKTERKCCPITTLSATNPTSNGVKSYPVLSGEKPATDFPSHGIFLVLQNCYTVYVGKDADFQMDLAPCASGSSVYLV